MSPAFGCIQPSDQPQQRAFAAAAAADDGNELAGRDVEVDAMQHLVTAERFGHAAQRHVGTRPSWHGAVVSMRSLQNR